MTGLAVSSHSNTRLGSAAAIPELLSFRLTAIAPT